MHRHLLDVEVSVYHVGDQVGDRRPVVDRHPGAPGVGVGGQRVGGKGFVVGDPGHADRPERLARRALDGPQRGHVGGGRRPDHREAPITSPMSGGRG